jgi:hypothetical protein
VLVELFLRNLGAIIVLEREQQAARARLGTGEQPLILHRIEPALRLQVRLVVHERRRRVARELAQLVVADADAAPTILLLEQHRHDHFVEDAVLDVTHLVLRQHAPFLLLLLCRLLDTGLPIQIPDVAAIHFSDGRSRGDRAAVHEARGVHHQEAHDKCDQQEQEDVLGQPAQFLQHHGVLTPSAGVGLWLFGKLKKLPADTG